MESCLCSLFLYPKVLTLLCGSETCGKYYSNSQGNIVIEKVRPIPSKTKINSFNTWAFLIFSSYEILK